MVLIDTFLSPHGEFCHLLIWRCFFLSTLPITMDLILQCKNLNEEKIDETLSGLLLL